MGETPTDPVVERSTQRIRNCVPLLQRAGHAEEYSLK
jgi:hypothetical protein